MPDAALLFLALLAATVGMGAFALANEAHWRQVLGSKARTSASRFACKTIGTGSLGLSFALCTIADPVSMAMLVWPMLLGIAAATVAAALTVRARRRPPV